MHHAHALAALALIGLGTPALAQEVVTELPDVELIRVPPTYSYDFGVQIGVSEVSYWADEVPPWASLGFFFTWGVHLRGNDRIGPSVSLLAEGPVPLHGSYSLEPTVRWDRIMGKLNVGASVGGAAMGHAAMRQRSTDTGFTLSPVVAARVGWSEGWTRVGRRLFIVAEPKLRLISGEVDASLLLQIGSGHGY